MNSSSLCLLPFSHLDMLDFSPFTLVWVNISLYIVFILYFLKVFRIIYLLVESKAALKFTNTRYSSSFQNCRSISQKVCTKCSLFVLFFSSIILINTLKLVAPQLLHVCFSPFLYFDNIQIFLQSSVNFSEIHAFLYICSSHFFPFSFYFILFFHFSAPNATQSLQLLPLRSPPILLPILVPLFELPLI